MNNINVDGNSGPIITGDKNQITNSFNNAHQYLKESDEYEGSNKTEIEKKMKDLESAINEKNKTEINKISKFIKKNWLDIYHILQPAVMAALSSI